MSNAVPTRGDLPEAMTWDLLSIYADDSAWEAEFSSLNGAEEPIQRHHGQLGDPAALAACLQERDELDRRLEKLYTYAHLRSDEDTGNSHYSGMQDRIRSRYMQFAAAVSWIEPEVLALPDEALAVLQAAPELVPFKRLMDVLLRDKPHTLGPDEEKLLAMAAEPLSVAYQAFSKLNNADLKFPELVNDKGERVRLTHGNYVTFLESTNRKVRRRAFEAVYDTYEGVKNTLAATLDGHVRKQVFYARARNHESALEASLHRDQVDPALYRGLIEAVHQALPDFYGYVDLRRRVLGLDKLDMYDQHVAIVPNFELKVPYEKSREWALASLEPLGPEYQKHLARAFEERWIDVLECQGKRSGAYSSGCHDTNPYILLNYQANLDNAFTLVHELGHSLHSHFSHATQPHLYSSYSIVVAEVASITNEALLFNYLLRDTRDKRFRAYLLNHYCDGFRTTLFRQTMFAEFELAVHELVEAGKPLTVDSLCDTYYELNARYYGEGVAGDRRIALEWARIPHFYYNFYVYKYATGFAAAQAFAELLLSGEPEAVEAYLGFLRSGSSRDPLDILAAAGVDLRQPDVLTAAFKRFHDSVAELSALV